MTFARPIDLRAGPTAGTYVFLTAACLLAILALLLSAVTLTLKLIGTMFAAAGLVAGWHQLGRQQGWQIIIFNSGAINVGPAGRARHPAELAHGSFRSPLFVTLPLRLADGRCRQFLVNPGNNDTDHYRRLLVWLKVNSALTPAA